MAIAGLIIIGVGILVALVGGILFLIAAFRVSALWGIGCLVPGLNSIVQLIFLFKYWEDARKGFLVQLAGCAIVVGGFSLMKHFAPDAQAFARIPGLQGAIESVEQAANKAVQEAENGTGVVSFVEDTGEEGSSAPAPSSLIGKSVIDVRRELGNPKSEFHKGDKTYFLYDGRQIGILKGVVVSDEPAEW